MDPTSEHRFFRHVELESRLARRWDGDWQRVCVRVLVRMQVGTATAKLMRDASVVEQIGLNVEFSVSN